MKEKAFYNFIRYYVFPRHIEIMQKRQWMRRVNVAEQAEKVDEELNEFLGATKSAPGLLTFITYHLADDLFVELYQEFIKDTKESEMADVILAKCYLMYIEIWPTPVCFPEIHPIWFIDQYFENIVKLSSGIKNIKLHLKAKMRYNSLRKDW